MEPRIGTKSQGYEVDMEKVNRAAKKAGMFEMFFNPPNEEEYNYLLRKKLTILQWRLLCLFKKMLDQELIFRKQEQQLISCENKIHSTGLSFKQKMLENETIAEVVFSEWANRIGISHLYNLSLMGDENEIQRTGHCITTCIDDFERKIVKNKYKHESYAIVEPVAKRGKVVSVNLENNIRNTSGKDIYQRFCEVLRILK